MSNLPALQLRGQMSTSCLACESFAIPTHVTTVSPLPNLIISQSCCCVRVGGVCFFLVFSIASGLVVFFQETPRPHSKRPGASFNAFKIIAPEGAFTPIVTVRHTDIVRKCLRYRLTDAGRQQCPNAATLLTSTVPNVEESQ